METQGQVTGSMDGSMRCGWLPGLGKPNRDVTINPISQLHRQTVDMGVSENVVYP